jgi:hypothetical protein
MHSLFEFIEHAKDPQFTEAQAATMIEENVADLERYCSYTRVEAHAMVLNNIGYFAGYYDAPLADRVYALYHTQHPIYGLTHPGPEEAFRLDLEFNRSQRHKVEA